MVSYNHSLTPCVLYCFVEKGDANFELTGSVPIKKTQGIDSRARVVEQYGCVVMEVQDWIDAINHPEWQREKKQIFGPEDGPYTLEARYEFSTS
jgi:aldose 1-epimerase